MGNMNVCKKKIADYIVDQSQTQGIKIPRHSVLQSLRCYGLKQSGGGTGLHGDRGRRSKDHLKGTRKSGLLLFPLNSRHSIRLLSSLRCHSCARISCLRFLFRPNPSTLRTLFHSCLCFPHPPLQHCVPLLITPPVCFLVSVSLPAPPSPLLTCFICHL